MFTRRALSRYVLPVVWACAAIVDGTAAAAVPEEVADRLMREGDMSAILDDTTRTSLATFDQIAQQQMRGVPQEELQLLRGRIERDFDHDRLYASVRKHLAESLEPEWVEEADKWNGTAVGQSVRALERKFRDAAAMPPDMIPKGRDLLEAAAPERQALFRRMVAGTRLADSMKTSTATTLHAMMTGMKSAMPALSDPPSVAEIEDKLGDTLKPAIDQFAMSMNYASAYIYAEVADRDLAAYVSSMESRSGSAYIEAQMRALIRAMGDMAEAFGRGLASDAIANRQKAEKDPPADSGGSPEPGSAERDAH
jgi:hypothetical protein